MKPLENKSIEVFKKALLDLADPKLPKDAVARKAAEAGITYGADRIKEIREHLTWLYEQQLERQKLTGRTAERYRRDAMLDIIAIVWLQAEQSATEAKIEEWE